MWPTTLQRSVLAACITCCAGSFAAGSEVVAIGQDVYVVTSQAKNGWSTPGAQKTKAYEKAHGFCAARGKELQVITSNVSSREPVSAELQFHCVPGK